MLSSYKLYREYKYQFTTEAGLEYFVYLEDYKKMSGFPDHLSCEIMFLTLTTKEYIKSSGDSRIQHTAVSIVLDYLKRHDDIICYICSNADGLAQARDKLFLRWFNLFNPGNYVREHRIIKNEAHIFIFDRNNKHAKQFLALLGNPPHSL